MKHARLRGKIREVYNTQEAFAEAMTKEGVVISVCSVSKKLNGHSEWKAAEIRTACKLLGIEPEDIPIYFPVYFF